MEKCIFCRIVNGDLPSSIVYSDEKIMAFMDVNPINPGHVLVIPKGHFANLSDLDPAIGGEIFKTAIETVASIKKQTSNVRE